MSKPKVLVTRRIPQNGLDLLASACEVSLNPLDRPLSRRELLGQAAEAQAVLGMLSDRIDEEFFEAAKKLKGYANYAVGFDNIDVASATRRKIPVSNTPDVLTLATAELAMTLILAVSRRIVETDAVMRSETWSGWAPLQFIGLDVSRKTLGLFGPGRIATALARLTRGFEMPVIYFGRSQNSDLEKEFGARRVDFPGLLAQSDFLSLHAPLTPETRHVFDSQAFAQMKPTSVLVNTARGPLVKESDLAQALRSGQIAGAGLDVHEFEPKLCQELKDLKNVIVLPHVGSATTSSREGMASLAARNILAMLAGERPPTVLNPGIYE